MTGGWYDAGRALARAAARVARRTPGPLPPLIVLTDPRRYPDIEAFAESVPSRSVLVHRHFGRPEAAREAHALRRIADRKGLILLIAADPALALQCGADGVHWPERLAGQVRLRHPAGMWLTLSAHSRAAAERAARLGADAVLLSPVFPTLSPGAGRSLGLWTAGAIARSVAAPVYALGGITPERARRLTNLGFSGIAAVSAAQ
ncbi:MULTISPECIES: thiamine phosphate synthase [Hyphobacterium]|uniref:Thiamine phosphate synthase n=1 Tax=Hyphobacterium vulgare TaxID=1736751 RepID=A0ABV6ZY23_9PROT